MNATQLDPQGLAERDRARKLREKMRDDEENHPTVMVDEEMDVGV